MARKTTVQAAPSGDPQAQQVPPALPSETPPLGPQDAETVAAAPAPAEPPAPQRAATGMDSLERVKALVLHDSIYGKCGEVREFDAEHVPALKGAGYIDPHPKAVESAGG